MKSFGKLFAVLCFCGLMGLVSGCKVDGDDPLTTLPPVTPPPPSGNPGHTMHIDHVGVLAASGYIYAGETGARVVVRDFGPNGIEVRSTLGGNQTWQCIVDSTNDVRFLVTATYAYASSGNYLDASLSGSIRNVSNLQISSAVVHDSMWSCQSWAIDSSATMIDTYNSLSGGTCSGGQAQFVDTDACDKPMFYPAGQHIDSQLPWGQGGGGYFYYSSERDFPSTLPNGTAVSNFVHRQYTFLNSATPTYIGIRWWDQNHYRYGYVKCAAAAGSVTVYAVAYER